MNTKELKYPNECRKMETCKRQVKILKEVARGKEAALDQAFHRKVDRREGAEYLLMTLLPFLILNILLSTTGPLQTQFHFSNMYGPVA